MTFHIWHSVDRLFRHWSEQLCNKIITNKVYFNLRHGVESIMPWVLKAVCLILNVITKWHSSTHNTLNHQPTNLILVLLGKCLDFSQMVPFQAIKNFLMWLISWNHIHNCTHIPTQTHSSQCLMYFVSISLIIACYCHMFMIESTQWNIPFDLFCIFISLCLSRSPLITSRPLWKAA